MTFKLRLGKRKRDKPSKPKAYLVDRFYLPKALVDLKKARKHYDRRLFDQKQCNRCPVYKDGNRFCDICAVCEHYKGRFTTFEEVEIHNEDYLAFPAGSIESVATNLDLDLQQFDIEDNRCDIKVKHPLKFTGKLFTGETGVDGFPTIDQVQIIKDFAKQKSGFIIAPARSGKAVMAVYIVCKSQRRTLFLAHKKELLTQFYKQLLENTDLRQQRKKTGQKIVGIIQNKKDWQEDWDVILCNYQQFITENGVKRLRSFIVSKIAQVIIDEAHRSNADTYINLVNRIDAKRKIGFTATFERKDSKQWLAEQVIGPIVAKGEVVSRSPSIEILKTNITPKNKFSGRFAYTFVCNWLADNAERNKLIIKNVFQDLRNNRYIVIPVVRRKQAFKLARMINAQGQFNNEHKGEKWPLIIAEPMVSGTDTERILNDARSGNLRVVVATSDMVEEGLTVSLWSVVYLIFPRNNAPKTYQLTNRIKTPMQGKPNPIIRMFVDNIGLCFGCFRSTYNHLLEQNCIIDKENQQIAELLLDTKPKSKHANLEDW